MNDLAGAVAPLAAAPLAKALANRGYETFTPVQQAVLAPELEGQDLLVSAQTGSGKTVAFGMAMAPDLLLGEERLPKAGKPLALAIAPTRELALQVKRELEWLYEHTGAVITSCVGGMDIRTERRALERGAHIVVGTPGRLRDHVTRKAFNTSDLRAVVLDEADEMLDLGFREDLEFILGETPAEKRVLLFSATVPAAIAKLAKSYQRDAVRVATLQERDQHADIEYRALVVAPGERENAIINVLRYYEPENALVFCNTRASVNHMVARFNNRGFSVVALSGELSQSERTHALQALRDGRAQVCIATDVAARGIDLPKLELVIHADLPSNPDTLLHRSGRTGRAGRKGISALMVDQKGRGRAERVLRFAKLEANWGTPPSADDVNKRDEERMMASEHLTLEPQQDETEFAERMLETFTPLQIATGFLRLNRAARSAPEDITMVSAEAPKKGKFGDKRGPREPFEKGKRSNREEFDKSIWLTLSVGRKQNAEPRWLIPLLCNAGEITKKSIGSIKIQQTETHVQLDAAQADKFLEHVGPNRTLEKNIRVTVGDNEPSGAAVFKPRKPRDRSADKKPPFKREHSLDGDDNPKRKKKKGKEPYKSNTDTDSGAAAPAEKKKKWDKSKTKPWEKPRSQTAGAPSDKRPAKPAGKPKKPKAGYPKNKPAGWAKKGGGDRPLFKKRSEQTGSGKPKKGKS